MARTKNYIGGEKPCKRCGVVKHIDNFPINKVKHYRIPAPYCKPCANIRSKEYYSSRNDKQKQVIIDRAAQWRLDNPEARKKSVDKYHRKNGIGIYQVILGGVCLYVGEGLLKARENEHIHATYQSDKSSEVNKYCFKHNINRELLSFNVLEYETDTARRKQKEDWYITFLNPVINKPVLKLYV